MPKTGLCWDRVITFHMMMNTLHGSVRRLIIAWNLFSLALVALGSLFGQHDCPLLSHRGEQTANEFQMIMVEHVKISRNPNYTFADIAPLLISNDDVVTVQFYSQTPSTEDWIGAYSPADADITATVPVKYGWCDEVSSYLTKGSGYLTFNLTNLRSDVKFYYFTGEFITPYFSIIYLLSATQHNLLVLLLS